VTDADETTGAQPYRVVVAASFTAEPIEPAIRFWTDQLPLPVDVGFAPYGQVFQELLGTDGAMATNTHGVNVLLVRFTDLVAQPSDGHLRQAAVDLADAVRDASARWSVPVVVVVCPSAPGVEEDFLLSLRDCPNVHAFGSAVLAGWYPGAGAVVTDAYTDRLGHVPYSATAFAALGTAVARRVYRVLAPEPKVVVVDADHTLWDGVAGEDDIADVRIGPARQAIQDLLAAQSTAGRLVCLCSRNTEADTVAVITGHPDMLLGLSDFAGLRVNWRPKSENLRELADELDLGLDSFVFLDDSPVECAEVRDRCPEVAVLQVPADADEAERFLRHCWLLDVGTTTGEDARRTAYYRTERERERVRSAAPTLDSFLDSLELRVHVDPAEASDIPRIAQLTRRTNQFHLAPRPRSEAEVGGSVRAGTCLVVRAEDRFGSYGTVGVVVLDPVGSTLRLRTFLLSCRSLGRGVEHRVLAHVGAVARQRGADTVDLVFHGTARNQPAADFVREVCGLPPTDLADGTYSLPAAEAAETRLHTRIVPRETSRQTPAQMSVDAPAPNRDAELGRRLWALGEHLAPDLCDPERIAARIGSGRTTAQGGESASIDETVAAIMAGVLGVDSVADGENFFELGGTSLGLIQFMSDIRDHFGVELAMDTLYNSELTVREIGASILLHSIAEPGDVSSALALIESMTDEQVEALLGTMEPTPSLDTD
jgi:FkbH-like protein